MFPEEREGTHKEADTGLIFCPSQLPKEHISQLYMFLTLFLPAGNPLQMYWDGQCFPFPRQNAVNMHLSYTGC